MTNSALFRQMDDLEGNLSMAQRLRIREQVIQEGANFERYVELLQRELNGEPLND
ncbi:MAG: hypothetical protein F6K30_19310 [Cyanothece sp. SIO2G6]|nr:hypothetical protein [Cyanothece sp. SIO2G6]